MNLKSMKNFVILYDVSRYRRFENGSSFRTFRQIHAVKRRTDWPSVLFSALRIPNTTLISFMWTKTKLLCGRNLPISFATFLSFASVRLISTMLHPLLASCNKNRIATNNKYRNNTAFFKTAGLVTAQMWPWPLSKLKGFPLPGIMTHPTQKTPL